MTDTYEPTVPPRVAARLSAWGILVLKRLFWSIRAAARSAIWTLMDAISPVLGWLHRHTPLAHGRLVTVLPPAPPGSLGDEAMMSVVAEWAQGEGFPAIQIIAYEREETWGDLRIEMSMVRAWNGVVGPVRFARAIMRTGEFYCIGADVLDGHYSERDSVRRLRMCRVAARIGADVVITGCSWNADPALAAVTEVMRLPTSVTVHARDPISAERLRMLIDNRVSEVADLAFLLQPVATSPRLDKLGVWAATARDGNAIIVGCAPNALMAKHLGMGIDGLGRLFAENLDRAFGRDERLRFVLVPHDRRTSTSDVELVRSINEQMDASTPRFALGELTAREARRVASQLDIAITARMHFGIACIASEVPCIGISYQRKFEGLWNEIGLGDWLVRPEDLTQTGNIAQRICDLAGSAESLSHNLHNHLPAILERARGNFRPHRDAS